MHFDEQVQMLRVKGESGQIEITLLRLRIMTVITMLLQKRRRRRSEERCGKKAGEEVAEHEMTSSISTYEAAGSRHEGEVEECLRIRLGVLYVQRSIMMW
jgi:hypothetical protein